MSSENVTASVGAALAAISAARPNWQDDPYLWGGIDHEYAQPLAEALEAHPIIGRLKGSRLTDGLGFGTPFDFGNLAKWFVYRAGKVGAGETLNDVERFAGTDMPEMLTVYALAGIEPKETVQLDSDMFLIPILQLPPSLQRNQALGINPTIVQIPPFYPKATAALAIKYKLVLAVSPVDRLSQEWANARAERDTRLAETRLCMTVACGGVPDLTATWSQPADISTPGIFLGGPLFNYAVGSSRRRPRNFNPTELQRVVRLFREFHGDRGAFHVPLERLSATMAQVRIVDRAIDLGIALESLLMHEGSGQRSDNQELNFKISVRGAWLSGATPEERHARAALLKKLYGVRSTAVHSGRSKGDAINLMGLLEAGENLCAELIVKILEIGRWPDWNKLVLGESRATAPA